jgi:hypothetical protein
MIKQVNEFISKSMKEITISIVLTQPNSKKPLENSITTYFIDYQSDALNFGMGGGAGTSGSGTNTTNPATNNPAATTTTPTTGVTK